MALRHAGARQGREPEHPTTLEVGELHVDLVHHMATLAGSPLQLTAKEFELLAYLARHAGKVCTHHMILKDVWGPGYGAESNYVRVYTHRLRKKMGDEEGRLLKTVPGIGYQLVPDAHSPRGERVERVAHQEHASLEGGRALDDEAAPRGDPRHGGAAHEAQHQRPRAVVEDGVGPDPGPLQGVDRLDLARHCRPPTRHERRDDGRCPHVLSWASASFSCSTFTKGEPRKPSGMP